MSNEAPRVYREIIEEVIRSTDEDNYKIGIEKNVLEEIKETWIMKICEYSDIGEYKIRHGYTEGRIGMDGYYGTYPPYSDYSYREYPHLRYPKEKEDRDSDYDQYDGLPPVSQEEELDSNDLTDSEGEVNEEETTKNIMLCLFDKVTRVKDKRRCTLKHGFLSIGKTDYTFNVANGDLEW
ncbi:hypothetical protein NEFER03_1713 [Nematocida sp. LUAm3]|nr:hypothetical protein NEFER03_1713 [Nematocida sp. LUAm3]KAI5175703.1 hypothetical protein NEFER02_1590 [Nematocida sp. LUAm2]KAI5178609.1 hypothetical protein NEFER01_1745 [Nematocida sp. LUAm1]